MDDDNDINIGDITIDVSGMHMSGASGTDYLDMANYNHTYTIPTSTTTSSYTISNGTWNTMPYITSTSGSNGISVTGDADINGSLRVGGKDIAKSLEAIERRLAILVPDPKKLEQYEALQKAYKYYKMLEALCEERKDDDESK